jgi:3',5'-cyclic-nucleotide phosphodiesterase
MAQLKRITLALKICLFLFNGLLTAQHNPSAFSVVPLGIKGGSDESNLSAYLLSAGGSNQYISLDAGTLHAGIRKAIEMKSLKGDVSSILQKNIRAYLISHPHLDHLAGMIINSPDDSNKPIYGLPFCISVIKDKYFSWKSWANFGDAGETPQLKKYHYVEMNAGIAEQIAGTGLTVTPYLLSHSSPYQSTAFLVSAGGSQVLYLGDTGADEVEKSRQLMQLWKTIAPLIRQHSLKAIFIEVSFANDQKKELLFGHLTPALLMQEMKSLASLAGAEHMKNLNIIITHQKPGANRETNIPKELAAANSLGLNLIFPQQGVTMHF